MIFKHLSRVWGILLSIVICSLICSQSLLSQEKLISNVFYETDLRQAIQDIAAQAEVNIMADNTVQGFVTMEIVDLPLEQALKRILSVGGYTFKKLDGYYLVGAAEPSNPSFSLLSVTESIPISYIPAKTAAELAQVLAEVVI